MDIETVVPARLQSLYTSDSPSPFPKGPITIYLGNQTVGKGDDLGLSRNSDIRSE